MSYDELIKSKVLRTRKTLITAKHYQVAVMTIFRKAAMDSPDPMNIDMKALITSENWGRIPDR